MSDATTTVGELRDRAARFVKERAWEPYHNPKDLAMALSIEAAELLEILLWRDLPSVAGLSEAGRAALREELADVVIYGLHLCAALGIDLSDAVTAKIAKNEAKYPAERFKGRAR